MKRFLIRDDVSRDEVEARFRELGWIDLGGATDMPAVISYKSSWADPTVKMAASYMENVPLACSYVFASDDAFRELQASFASAGLTISAGDVLKQQLSDSPETLRILGRLGLLAHGRLDSKIFAKLSAALIHPNPEWQRYALYSLSNTSWSEFDTVLEQLIERGGFDDSLRDFAVSMRDSLRASNWNQTLYAE